MKIIDGSGDGYGAKVDSNNRLHVTSISRSGALEAIENGFGYNVSTGAISLTTTASYSGLLYLKNDSELSLHLLYGFFDNTSSPCAWKIVKNPTAGTLISGGSTATPVNNSFGSAAVAEATCLKGADASTVTDGTTFFEGSGPTQLPFEGRIMLSKNDTIAFMAKPDASATVYINLAFYYDDHGV